MMGGMKLSDFDYDLPDRSIALYPAGKRDLSRLLVVRRRDGSMEHRRFRHIIDYLRAGDVLVLNDTKVIPARLPGVKPTGGRVEILLLRELRTNTWQAMVKGIRSGRVNLKNGITASVSRSHSYAEVSFTCRRPHGDIRDALHEIGLMPIPLYIKRGPDPQDKERYQTVYSNKEGAVAAPTAGLHFTDTLIRSIVEKGVNVGMLTLHVGYGTFKPVTSTDIRNHGMDEEYFEIPDATARVVNNALSDGRRVVTVGTTVTRALEASAGEGRKGWIEPGAGKTSLFISPGYRFRVVRALITNFHLPRSTPMMLTAAFSGLTLLKRAYHDAHVRGYRFYSYGDAMLLL
jgi:S-adenosylmethionine:tRNA ribosyltransferase-isomerase